MQRMFDFQRSLNIIYSTMQKILSGYTRRDNADGVKGWYYSNKTVLGIDKKDIFY